MLGIDQLKLTARLIPAQNSRLISMLISKRAATSKEPGRRNIVNQLCQIRSVADVTIQQTIYEHVELVGAPFETKVVRGYSERFWTTC